MMYEGMEFENPYKKKSKILGMPRGVAFAVAALVVVLVAYGSFQLVGGRLANSVSDETIQKVYDCVSDRTADINHRARADRDGYGSDRNAIQKDIAEANKRCEAQFGVKEMPTRPITQTHTDQATHTTNQ